MRLWSLHPSLLDRAGLVALWREALLAQAVLLGKTKGYKNHPQLERFKKCEKKSIHAISTYLWIVHEEAVKRGYQFDSSKIAKRGQKILIQVTKGQVRYEMEHLRKKLKRRDPEKLKIIQKLKKIPPHPLFQIVIGDVEAWEKI